MVSQTLFRQCWPDLGPSGRALYGPADADWNAIGIGLRERFGLEADQMIDQAELKAAGMAVFDRTFTVTRVLRLLAVLVAFVGIFSALMAMLLEQGRERAILRATGVTRGQLLGLVGLQTGLMGPTAGLLALPLGLAMGRMLIQVINLRSFGWSLQRLLPVDVLFEGVLLALVAALLAGVYPAIRMMQTTPAMALREE